MYICTLLKCTGYNDRVFSPNPRLTVALAYVNCNLHLCGFSAHFPPPPPFTLPLTFQQKIPCFLNTTHVQYIRHGNFPLWLHTLLAKYWNGNFHFIQSVFSLPHVRETFQSVESPSLGMKLHLDWLYQLSQLYLQLLIITFSKWSLFKDSSKAA